MASSTNYEDSVFIVPTWRCQRYPLCLTIHVVVFFLTTSIVLFCYAKLTTGSGVCYQQDPLCLIIQVVVFFPTTSIVFFCYAKLTTRSGGQPPSNSSLSSLSSLKLSMVLGLILKELELVLSFWLWPSLFCCYRLLY